MAVLAAAVLTKSGRVVLSRQFVEMSGARIEEMLTTFPRLISAADQHTSVETDSVRFVYQPLDDLYVVLLTTKQSNILQDIDTLHLFTRLVSETCRGLTERDVSRAAFQLIFAFDEVVSLGQREDVDVIDVRKILEMDSHEERIQDEIARNKELEAKAELKRKMKMMEQQKRDQQRAMRLQSQFSGSGDAGFGGGMPGGHHQGGSSTGGGYGAIPGGGQADGYGSPYSAAVQPLPEQVNASHSTSSASAGKGLKLGKF